MKSWDVRDLARKLEEVYGPAEDRYPGSFPDQGRGDPLDTLILTILSQATSDVNSLKAYKRLRERFPTWGEVERAHTEEVARALKPGGLGPQKAATIQTILGQISRQRGELNLDFLAALDADEAFEYLVGFSGVGPKTAACVLLFALGHPRFPVDTHVARILRRLGLAGEKDSAVSIQASMEQIVPQDQKFGLHLNLIQHGREVCLARSPRCHACPLLAGCSFGLSLQDHSAASGPPGGSG